MTNLDALEEATKALPYEERQAVHNRLLGWLAAEVDGATWRRAVERAAG